MELARDRARLVSMNESLIAELERLQAAAMEMDSSDMLSMSLNSDPGMIGGVAQDSLLSEIQDQLLDYTTPRNGECGEEEVLASPSLQPKRIQAAERKGGAATVSSASAGEISRKIDAAREFFYMLVQTIIIGRTHPSSIALMEAEGKKHEQTLERFKTAAALAEASGAYGEPHLYGLYKQATEGPCTTEKPSVFAHTRRRKWYAWMACGEMSTDAAMRAYIDLVAQLSPSWGNQEVEGRVACQEDEDMTASYYFLSHEAIDGLYNYGRQNAVPMQDWHTWIEKRLDTAVSRYIALDEEKRDNLKELVSSLTRANTRDLGAPETMTASSPPELGSLKPINSDLGTVNPPTKLKRVDSSTVIASMITGQITEDVLTQTIGRLASPAAIAVASMNPNPVGIAGTPMPDALS